MPNKLPPIPRRQMRGLTKVTPKEAQENTAVRHIQQHPQYELICASLAEGVKVAELARYFAAEGFLSINEKTFIEYIFAWKRTHVADINKHRPGFTDDSLNVDGVVSGRQPEVDIDVEIDRTIRLQKLRVGLGMGVEKSVGVPMRQVTDDMKTLGEILTLKAKRKGLLSVTKAIDNAQSIAPEVRDTLSTVKKDEEGQDRLYNMAKELVNARTTG